MLLNHALARWLAVPCLSAFAAAAFGAPADAFEAAYAKAEAAAREAHALRNEWITVKDKRKWTSAQSLERARTLASAGKYDEAIRAAQEVEALAQAEIGQAEEQARDWPRAKIR